MFGIISLVMVVVVSMLVTRVATIALTHTGLSRQSARFQARSALTGSGFTTSESEKVVNDNLVLYGHLDAIEALDKRRRTGFAEQSHVEATIKHRKEKEASSEGDEESEASD